MAVTTLDPVTALVLIDLQQGIAEASTVPHRAPSVIERAVRLAESFRAHDLPVVLVRVTSAAGAQTSNRTDQAAAQRTTRTRPEGWDTLVAELAVDPADIVVTKRNWGAFYGTDLDLQLRRRGVTQIVLGGIATSIGVESTARAAHEHGYHLTLVTDAMGDLNADAHRHSVERIFPRLGETGTTEEVLDLLAKTHP